MTFNTSTTIEEQIDCIKKYGLLIQKTYSISMCGINCFINKFYLLSTLSFLLFLCL